MFVIKVDRIRYKMSSLHTVGYADNANMINEQRSFDGNIKWGFGKTLEQAKKILVKEIKEYLKAWNLKPKDFSYSYYFEEIKDNKLWGSPCTTDCMDEQL